MKIIQSGKHTLWIFSSMQTFILRYAKPDHPQHAISRAAVKAIIDAGDRPVIATQNLIEFWNVATRPSEGNGFGLSPTEAVEQLQLVEDVFTLLPARPETYPIWRHFATTIPVLGIHVHDAHLVATMKVYGISHILTLNGKDFRRYASEGIVVVHPQDVV